MNLDKPSDKLDDKPDDKPGEFFSYVEMKMMYVAWTDSPLYIVHICTLKSYLVTRHILRTMCIWYKYEKQAFSI